MKSAIVIWWGGIIYEILDTRTPSICNSATLIDSIDELLAKTTKEPKLDEAELDSANRHLARPKAGGPLARIPCPPQTRHTRSGKPWGRGCSRPQAGGGHPLHGQVDRLRGADGGGPGAAP